MRHVILLFGFVLLIFTSCSKENIENNSSEDLGLQTEEISIEFVKTNENLTSNFLPTFTNYHGRDPGTSTYRSASLASEWIHDYDENDNLVKSSFYELYPYRMIKEVNYLNIGEDQILTYELKEYNYFGLIVSRTTPYEILLDENLNIKRITPDQGRIAVFEELNEQGWVTTIHTVTSEDHILYKSGYDYDETGKVLQYRAYATPGVSNSTVDYTYNEQGDPLSYHFQNTAGDEAKVAYYYDENNILRRLEEEYNYGPDDFGTKVFTYTPQERLSKQTTIKGDGSKEVITFNENEIVVENFLEDDVISEVKIYNIQDERAIIKLCKEYLNGVVHKIMFYDAEGELDYTEYYDENGNLTETVEE